MKHLLTTTLLTLTTMATYAQLGTPLALYSGNQIVYNPGYAGIYDLLAVNVSAQQSWTGVKGAPSIVNFNGYAPFQKDSRHSFGWVYQRESLAMLAGHSAAANYAYKVPLGENTLNLGLQVGVLHNVVDWNQLEYVQDRIEYEELLNPYREGKTQFDASVGSYFMAKNWYVGLSFDHLTSPRYARMVDSAGSASYFRMNVQTYLMAGYNYEIDETWSVQPEFFMRYVANSPLSLNMGAFVYYTHAYALGMGYRTGQKTLNFNLKFHINDNIRVGYSYGVPLGTIRKYQNGNHEITISYISRIWGEKAEMGTDLIWL